MNNLKHNILTWGFISNLIKVPMDIKPIKSPIKKKYNNKHKYKKND